jgi:hypothetical protein
MSIADEIPRHLPAFSGTQLLGMTVEQGNVVRRRACDEHVIPVW